MSLFHRKPHEVSMGYELIEVGFVLRRLPQELEKAGLLKRIKKTYPHGRQNPLYDVEQIEALEVNLIRLDGLVAFKVLPPDTPLLHAFEPGYSGELDCTCPECGGIAVGDPRTPADERAVLIKSDSWPRLLWCFACGFVEVDYSKGKEDHRYRLLGQALPEITKK